MLFTSHSSHSFLFPSTPEGGPDPLVWHATIGMTLSDVFSSFLCHSGIRRGSFPDPHICVSSVSSRYVHPEPQSNAVVGSPLSIKRKKCDVGWDYCPTAVCGLQEPKCRRYIF